ncbi:PLC-like phosphodiesterase [Mrakia frigida]|uniref:PLC-like phosphodiesterase n=1 Tax=Mrakia frigida TaxID=29902 RepID=UPI003FCC1F3A
MLASAVLALSVVVAPVLSSPVVSRSNSGLEARWAYQKYFDLQGHRGGRGHYVESTLPAFADALLNGVTSLELDAGLSKDGHLIVWHDEAIDPTKCNDTGPAFPNDPFYPYVGKYIANLTLSQIKTLDCGSQRLVGFPLQVTVPGTKLSTMDEFFDFIHATDEPVLFNIESKVDGDFHNLTRSPEDFAEAMAKTYTALGPEMVDRITHQSFDWRTIILSKEIIPSLRTSALFDDTTIYANPAPGVGGNLSIHGDGPSNWLAGINIDSFNGSTVQERVVLAAASIGADFVSPAGTSYASNVTDPTQAGYIPLVTKAMVDLAHSLDIGVKPWTINRLSIVEYLVGLGVDGIITDYPRDVRVWAKAQGLKVAPLADERRIEKCLKKHNQLTVQA